MAWNPGADTFTCSSCGAPYQLKRTTPTLHDFLKARNVDVVFDVGGNDGNFGLSLRQEGYQGLIVSFEPLRAAYDLLKARADQDGAWETHPVALGERPGKAVINVSKANVFSSLLDQRAAAVTFDANAASTRTEEVTVATLDQFAPTFADRACFLKIDTQGYERQVLLGATATLPMLQGFSWSCRSFTSMRVSGDCRRPSGSCWIAISWSLRFIPSICTGLTRCLG